MSDDDPLSTLYGPEPVEADLSQDDGIADEYADLGTRRRASVLTIALGVGVGLAIAFTAGVLVQKHHDAGTSSSTALAGGPPAGFPSGGAFPGLGAGGGAGGGTAGSGAGAGQASGASDAGPVLVGTVVKVTGTTVTVQDLAGHTFLVSTTSATTITKSSGVSLSSLKVGSSVSVDGTKSASTVKATALTSR